MKISDKWRVGAWLFLMLLLRLSARTLSLTRGFCVSDALLQFVYRHFNLEKGLLTSFTTFVVGFLIDSYIAYQ